MGGFMAVSTTDLVQSIVISIYHFIIICFLWNISGGGWE